MQRITGALILAVLLHANIQAADYNIVPPVTSFTKNDYDAERQNWNIAQDSRGIMYFANTAGLLQYDANTLATLPDAESYGTPVGCHR